MVSALSEGKTGIKRDLLEGSEETNASKAEPENREATEISDL